MPASTITAALEPGIPALTPSVNDTIWWGKLGPMFGRDRIITQSGRSFALLTGQQHTWTDPAGVEREWRCRRSHGCGPMAGSLHLIGLRSGDAGFYDLAGNGGTGNLGGFRSGCTPSLIVADGVLNAPDYTRGCVCAYQNRSSLALVTMDEVEYWTFGAPPTADRVAFNLGAPGDRRARDGTLWWSTPIQARYAQHPEIVLTPATAQPFYHHVSRMQGTGDWNWVAASGVTGLQTATVPCPLPGALTVTLVFAETEGAAPGQRVFDVLLDGREVFRDLDVVKEAGGPWRPLVKEFPVSAAANRAELKLEFRAKTGAPLLCGVAVRPQPGR
jgi:hypothetical protein